MDKNVSAPAERDLDVEVHVVAEEGGQHGLEQVDGEGDEIDVPDVDAVILNEPVDVDCGRPDQVLRRQQVGPEGDQRQHEEQGEADEEGHRWGDGRCERGPGEFRLDCFLFCCHFLSFDFDFHNRL